MELSDTRPDELDRINAFRMGFRHGKDVGICSPREAEEAIRSLPTTVPITTDTIGCFCNGADDGARGDTFRYILTFAVCP